MIKKSNKIGAVELSLNLIIMLIIGMVVLGLVIGFVNSLVGKGTESFDKQLGDNEKLKLEDVKACADNLCVNPSPSVSVKKGGDVNLFIKVRAYLNEEINCEPGELEQGCQVSYTVTPDEDGGDISGITVTGPGFSAVEGTEDAKMYRLKASTDTAIGIYYLTIKLLEDTSKTITIEVK